LRSRRPFWSWVRFPAIAPRVAQNLRAARRKRTAQQMHLAHCTRKLLLDTVRFSSFENLLCQVEFCARARFSRAQHAVLWLHKPGLRQGVLRGRMLAGITCTGAYSCLRFLYFTSGFSIHIARNRPEQTPGSLHVSVPHPSLPCASRFIVKEVSVSVFRCFAQVQNSSHCRVRAQGTRQEYRFCCCGI